MSSLALYWDLASIDESTRLQAADSLIKLLLEFQSCHSSENSQSNHSINSPEDLDSLCAPDVSYGLKRLLRGLPSGREGARQGFSVALSELLRSMPIFKTSLILDLLMQLTESQGSIKGQEERDIYFGRLFGILAITNAGLLTSNLTTSQDVQKMISLLIEYSQAKIYLRMPAFQVISNIMSQIKGQVYENEVLDFAITNIIKDNLINCEQLFFTLMVQQNFSHDWAKTLPKWHKGNPLHPKNLNSLTSILKESTYMNPIIHPVWDCILDIVINIRPKSCISILELWIALDDMLFNSTNERKFLGFKLFEKILVLLPADSVSIIFTSHFLRCLMNHLSNKDNYLHKVARRTSDCISKNSLKNPEVAFNMVLQLIGNNGFLHFDSLSKTKTVESILHNLTVDQIVKYVDHLQAKFMNKETGEFSEDSEKGMDIQRQRILDQLASLFKIPKVPKVEEWMTKVIHFLCSHAYFLNSNDVPEPPLSLKTRKACQERIHTVLSSLQSVVLDDKKDQKSFVGLMENGEHWSRFALKTIEKLSSSDCMTLAQPLDDEIMDIIKKGSSLVSVIRKKAKQIRKAEQINTALLNQLSSFENLVAYIVIQAYSDPQEIVGVIEDLESCFEKIWEAEKSTLGKKRKSSDSNDSEDPMPIDVLVDILMSLLAKPSAPLRNLAVDVFKAFSSQVSGKSMDIIFEILKSKAGPSGADDLFEEDDEMEVDESDEAEDSSDEQDTDEESEQELPTLIQETSLLAEDDDALGDDQMEDYDAKLGEIFKQRAQLKTAKKDAKQHALHFKFRVIDLLEVFIQMQSKSALIMDLVIRILKIVPDVMDEPQLRDRLSGLLKNKMIKIKDLPKLSAIEVRQGFAVLEEIHQSAIKAKDVSFVALCSSASIIMVRILGSQESTTKVIETPSKKSKTESGTYVQESNVSQIVKVYMNSLTDFMKKNKSRVKPSLFLDLFSRYPEYSWEILPGLVEFLSEKENPKAYNLIQGYNMIARIMKQTSNKVDELKLGIMKNLAPKIAENLIHSLTANATVNEGPYCITKDRFKDLLKDLLLVVRRTKKMGFSTEELSKLWKSELLIESVQLFRTKREQMSAVPSITNLSKELSSIFSKV